ncbi:MAG TPA: prohibitin family protein [Flavobacteriaceae bacterium]|nr:prohibitin family protein [Flavobacteriaceae bacterium]
MEKLPKIALPGIITLIVLTIIIAKSAVTIGAGEAGVLFERFGQGVVTDKTYAEGFHVVAPWNSMIVYKVRQQSISDKMKVLSVNGLEVVVDGTVWFMPEYEKLGLLHKTKGLDYVDAILSPAISAAARSVVGRYTPEQLYSSKRDVIQNEVLEEVRNELENQYIIVNRVLIEDVTLPPTIKEAIELKLKQEQESLEYQFRIEKAEKEAARQRIEAQGKADANSILSASLTDKILQDKGIEATIKLSESPNSKVIIIGSGDSGMPIILGNQ